MSRRLRNRALLRTRVLRNPGSVPSPVAKPAQRRQGRSTQSKAVTSRAATSKSAASTCPCTSGRSYSQCCRGAHLGTAPALTAEALMRARYCAFVKQLEGYLLRSWHPDHRPESCDFDPHLTWTGLCILRCEKGQPEDVTGLVEFEANFTRDGVPGTLHETSRFERVDGSWAYTTGEVL